jgi:hypothetical protein
MILALSRGVCLHPITIWAMKGSSCPSFAGCWCHRRAQSGVVSRHVVFKSCRPKKKCGQSLSLWTHRWSMMTMFRMSPKHGYFSLKELWSYLLIVYWMGWPSSCTSYIWRYYSARFSLPRFVGCDFSMDFSMFQIPVPARPARLVVWMSSPWRNDSFKTFQLRSYCILWAALWYRNSSIFCSDFRLSDRTH